MKAEIASLDGHDRMILELLQADGRMTNAALSHAVGLTPTPTLQRVRRLEEQGIIRRYVALLDPARVEHATLVWVQVTLEQHALEHHLRFVEAVGAMPEVQEVHHVAGEEDFVLKVRVKDIAAYEDFLLHKLTQVGGIRRVKSTFVLSTKKDETAIPVDAGGS